jgi:N-acetyl-gamma-glutamyl-phosphate reductase
MIRVSVVGATGYTGGELLRILNRHPEVRVTHVTTSSSAGKRLEEVHPHLRKDYDLTLEAFDARRLAADTDVAFFALPHGVGSKAIAQFLATGRKVVDLSADFRLRDQRTYEAWYKVKHASPKLLKEAVYGLPELFRDKIPPARLVANPGCYATTTILALAPLLRRGLIDPSTVVVDAKSGVSGAGKKLDLMYHFPECAENFQAYAVAKHRHVPEIEQALKDASGRAAPLTFVPHLVPMTRGILANAYARLKKKVPLDRLRAAFEEDYGGERFIRILPEGRWPQTRDVSYTNFVDVNLALDERNGRVIVLAALDNLVKGAAGQAVQNLNLSSGLDEAAGLVS